MHHSKTRDPVSIDGWLLSTDEGETDVDETDFSMMDFRRLVLAARREFHAAEGRFLDRNEISREVAERRGGSATDEQE